MAAPMMISSAVPPLPPVPTTPWAANAGGINIPTFPRQSYRERGGVARRSRWSARFCIAMRRREVSCSALCEDLGTSPAEFLCMIAACSCRELRLEPFDPAISANGPRVPMAMPRAMNRGHMR